MNRIDLHGRRVILGVTGSISAYKACELCRSLVGSGADVHVVLSESAEKFVSALTFEALSANEVLTSSSENWSGGVNHISIIERADIFVVAPATANSINKMAKGIADTPVLQAFLAFGGKKLIAPAANTGMLKNHYTAGSLKMLSVDDVTIVDAQKKRLACGTEGYGALAEVDEIYMQICRELYRDDFWNDRKVVVTGGGTREAIDTVRYIGNRSSGKMANAIATALYLKGADVCLITTAPHDDLPSDIYVIDVDDAQEMAEYTVDAVRVAKKGKLSKPSMNASEPISLIRKKPYLFMVSAVGDYRPKYPQSEKMKKSDIGEVWNLELVQNPDIVASIDKDGLITVAFKAESDSERGIENAKRALEEKGVDAICYNDVSDEKVFGSEENEIVFITKRGMETIERDDKSRVALKILEKSKKLDDEA
jgi:phosphopantothenoylcysteine decarboxylase/phosphopantothenate--cysteine ligase